MQVLIAAGSRTCFRARRVWILLRCTMCDTVCRQLRDGMVLLDKHQLLQ